MYNEPIAFKSVGVFSWVGADLKSHWDAAMDLTDLPSGDRSLDGFEPGPYLSDRRVLKSISNMDAVGLVGIEQLRRDAFFPEVSYQPHRVGMYIGCPPSYVNDNQFYLDAMLESRDASGRCSVREFGRTSRSVRPTALLFGLSNNVLSYGSNLLQAQGPNSNYNQMETSGHLAVINAARRLQRHQLDRAIAGGFSVHTVKPNRDMFEEMGIRRLADGAVFFCMERGNNASDQYIAQYLGGAVACDGTGPMTGLADGNTLAATIRAALTNAGASPDDVGLVTVSASGIDYLDDSEVRAVKTVFSGRKPAVASTAFFGNLMEAGGLLDIAFAKYLYEIGTVPAALLPHVFPDLGCDPVIDRSRPLSVITRSAIAGEYTALVIR